MGLSAAAEAIARGTDDAMWIAEPAHPGRVARVTTAGAVTEFRNGVTARFPSNNVPRGMAVTPDGSAWFLLTNGTNEVGRIAPNGTFTPYNLTSGAPTSLTTGPDGRLWMTAEGATAGDPDLIARYDVTTAATTRFSAAFNSQTDPGSITAGADGALWFVENSAPYRVGRITTSGTVTWQSIGGPATALGAGPTAPGFARGGTRGLLTSGAPSLVATGNTPKAIAAGPDGAVWAAGTGAAIRVAADGTVATVTAGIAPAAVGVGLAAGADGRMWMTLDRSPYLVRITVPPAANGAQATATAATAATVTATVRPNGLATTATVEVRRADGTWAQAGTTSAGAGTASLPVSFSLSGLAPGAASSVRVSATNAAGTTTTDPVSVITPGTRATTPAPATSNPAAVPVPVQGRSVVLQTGAGTVRVKAPGGKGYTRLSATSTLPVGSLVDTTKGTVALSAKLRTGTQSGRFNGGVFRVRQATKGTGVTQLYLAGRLSCSTARAAAAGKPRTTRRLWGRDKGGKFKTHGRDSTASVRGTRWLTEDTCAGTTVRVLAGAVAVTPTHGRGKTVVVRAGGRHFTPHH